MCAEMRYCRGNGWRRVRARVVGRCSGRAFMVFRCTVSMQLSAMKKKEHSNMPTFRLLRFSRQRSRIHDHNTTLHARETCQGRTISDDTDVRLSPLSPLLTPHRLVSGYIMCTYISIYNMCNRLNRTMLLQKKPRKPLKLSSCTPRANASESCHGIKDPTTASTLYWCGTQQRRVQCIAIHCSKPARISVAVRKNHVPCPTCAT